MKPSSTNIIHVEDMDNATVGSDLEKGRQAPASHGGSSLSTDARSGLRTVDTVLPVGGDYHDFHAFVKKQGNLRADNVTGADAAGRKVRASVVPRNCRNG
eukprot:8606404-Pyramimonas_sp.AAC.3